MNDVTTERITEQQERIAAIEIAIVYKLAQLQQLKRLLVQENNLYKKMTENGKVTVFHTENE